MDAPPDGIFELPTPLLCPVDAAPLKIVHLLRGHRAILLYCPKCSWTLDLELQRRIERHRGQMEQKLHRPVTLTAAAADLRVPPKKAKK